MRSNVTARFGFYGSTVTSPPPPVYLWLLQQRIRIGSRYQDVSSACSAKWLGFGNSSGVSADGRMVSERFLRVRREIRWILTICLFLKPRRKYCAYAKISRCWFIRTRTKQNKTNTLLFQATILNKTIDVLLISVQSFIIDACYSCTLLPGISDWTWTYK